MPSHIFKMIFSADCREVSVSTGHALIMIRPMVIVTFWTPTFQILAKSLIMVHTQNSGFLTRHNLTTVRHYSESIKSYSRELRQQKQYSNEALAFR